MTWFRRPRTAPPDPVASRRRFVAGTGAVLASTLLADPSWAAVEARAEALGITPGTVVDAHGQPTGSEPMAATPYIGEIMMFGGNFAPREWAFCDGQLLSIASNAALFSLIGTTYGGDGRITFGLPDLRGRVPIHSGNGSAGPGLSPRPLGSKGGREQVTLTSDQLPAHDALPTVRLRGTGPAAVGVTDGGDLAGMLMGTPQGGGQAHNNMPPVLGIHYCIALFGLFPSRS